jgi:hypothetical protein
MKKFVVLLIGAYLLAGFAFAIGAYSHDLRYFICEDLNAPHGYIGMSTISYKNPDPRRCVRRGSELKSIAAIPLHTVFGVPLFVMKRIAGAD